MRKWSAKNRMEYPGVDPGTSHTYVRRRRRAVCKASALPDELISLALLSDTTVRDRAFNWRRARGDAACYGFFFARAAATAAVSEEVTWVRLELSTLESAKKKKCDDDWENGRARRRRRVERSRTDAKTARAHRRRPPRDDASKRNAKIGGLGESNPRPLPPEGNIMPLYQSPARSRG